MFYRLMRRAVLTDKKGVMSKDVNRLQSHQRRETYRRTAVIGKDQKRGSVRDKTAVKGHTVDDRSHGVFTDTEVQIAPGKVSRLHRSRTLDITVVGGRKIG